MCPYHIRPTRPIVTPLDRRDPDYIDVDQEYESDKIADHIEEVWKERKIDNDKKSGAGNQVIANDKSR